jgi:uncharacterized membrane protein
MNSYDITDLGFGPGATYLNAINEKGIAVGVMGHRAIRYGGLLDRLEAPSDFSHDAATGINDGTPEIIVGHVTVDQSSAQTASLWIDEKYFDLHKQLNASSSSAADINDKGIVLGNAGTKKPFRFNTDTQQLEILSLGDPEYCMAHAINTHGNFVGWISLPSDPIGVPFLYDGATHLLPTPFAAASAGARLDVNDSDVVVGTYHATLNGDPHAFRYEHHNNQKLVDLHPAEFQSSYAHGINNQNQVVGTVVDDKGSWATIWTLDEGMRKLNDLLADPFNEWILLEAYDINDKGQIVGYGTNAGQLRGFLMTPAPTPVSSSLDLTLGELTMEMKIVWLPGGIGIRLGGGLVHPKGPPVDPGGPLVLEPFQRDALTGLAIQALATNIADPQARLLAEHSGTEVVRMAVAHSLPGHSAKLNNPGCLSGLWRKILMRR